MELVEGDKDNALKMLEIGTTLAEEIYYLNVSNEYRNAKEYLYNWVYYDLRSLAMIIDGMPIEDSKEVMNKGMGYILEFIDEMNRLGHNIKF